MQSFFKWEALKKIFPENRNGFNYCRAVRSKNAAEMNSIIQVNMTKQRISWVISSSNCLNRSNLLPKYLHISHWIRKISIYLHSFILNMESQYRFEIWDSTFIFPLTSMHHNLTISFQSSKKLIVDNSNNSCMISYKPVVGQVFFSNWSPPEIFSIKWLKNIITQI